MPLNAQPEPLLSERLALMPRGPEHAAALFDAFSDCELWRFVPSEPPSSAKSLETRFARAKAGPAAANERWWNWAVALRDTPASLIGTVELSLFDEGRRALLAYIFARRSWGQGYACEACGAVLAYLRKTAPIVSVEAFIDTRNCRSIELVERLGFRRIETRVGADYFKAAPSDEYHYRLETLSSSRDVPQ